MGEERFQGHHRVAICLSKEWTISEEIGISKEKHSRRNLEWISKLSPRKENPFYCRMECKEKGKRRKRVWTQTPNAMCVVRNCVSLEKWRADISGSEKQISAEMKANWKRRRRRWEEKAKERRKRSIVNARRRRDMRVKMERWARRECDGIREIREKEEKSEEEVKSGKRRRKVWKWTQR